MLSNIVITIIYLIAFILYLSTLFIDYGCRVFSLAPYSSTDNIITSRNRNNWLTIGTSLYTGAMGSWVLSVPIGTAIDGSIWAVVLYAASCSLCWLTYIYFGIKLRRILSNNGYTVLERVKMRYGQMTYIIVGICTLCYLLFVLIGEFITVGKCYEILAPKYPTPIVVAAVSLFSSIYSALGGMPATMTADRIIGIVTIIFTLATFVTSLSYIVYFVPSTYIKQSFYFDSNGFQIGLSIFVAIMLIELINQGTWQRCYSARTEKDLKKGIALGVVLMFLSMALFGIVGCLCKAAKFYGLIYFDENSSPYSLFLLIQQSNIAVYIIVLFMIIIFTASTATYVQTAFVGILVGLFKNPTSRNSILFARLFGILCNIGAVLLATINPPTVLEMLMYGNILCTAVVPVILLSFTSVCTSFGAISAIIIGIISIFVIGAIFTHSFLGALSWPTFPEGYNYRCTATFALVFLISTAVCILFSYLQILFDNTKNKKKVTIVYKENRTIGHTIA